MQAKKYVARRKVEIGKRIQKIRRDNKWSQTDLAEFLECSRARINRAESGAGATFEIAELELMAEQFDMSTSDLIGWNND